VLQEQLEALAPLELRMNNLVDLSNVALLSKTLIPRLEQDTYKMILDV